MGENQPQLPSLSLNIVEPCQALASSLSGIIRRHLRTQLYSLSGMSVKVQVWMHTKPEQVSEFTLVMVHGSVFLVQNETMDSFVDLSESQLLGLKKDKTLVKEDSKLLTPSVRGPNAKIFVSFNPQDIEDYVSEYFIENPRPNSYIMKINYGDYPEAFNPATEDEYQESIRRGDPNHEHIWNGAYRNALGLIFDASKINLTEAYTAEGLALELGINPQTIIRCRAWDFGATKGAGDFTVGMRMARLGSDTEAIYMIEDIARGRWSPDETDAETLDTAISDSTSTIIRLAQDPGSAGVRDNSRVTKMLAPWTDTLVSESISGSKVKRSAGFASAVNNGLIYAPQASWLRPLQRELRAFTGLRTDMDDQVDTGGDAYELLSSRIRQRQGVLAI